MVKPEVNLRPNEVGFAVVGKQKRIKSVHRSQKYGLIEDIEVDREGLVHAPNGPGIGAAIDFELIERKTVEVLR